MNAKVKTATTLIATLLGVTSGALSDDFALDWWSVDGGGAMLTTSGDYVLSGTVGQPDPGEVVLTGGDYALTGGFWGVATGEPEPIPGDIDGDGDVDLSDLAALLASYGACDGDPGYDPAADLDGSGCVDLSDLAELLAHYGEGL